MSSGLKLNIDRHLPAPVKYQNGYTCKMKVCSFIFLKRRIKKTCNSLGLETASMPCISEVVPFWACTGIRYHLFRLEDTEHFQTV